MKAGLIYLIVAVFFLVTAVVLQKRYCILCDASTARPKPFSFSRVQLTWWTFIILASFVSVILATGEIPTLDDSTLVLLGIGAMTHIASRAIDVSDNAGAVAPVNQVAPVAGVADPGDPVPAPPAPEAPVLSINYPSEGFWLDILSDKYGVSIHRFQAFVFNLVFGVWFIYKTAVNLKGITVDSTISKINAVIPVIGTNNLILLGLSAGTYAALKITENR